MTAAIRSGPPRSSALSLAALVVSLLIVSCVSADDGESVSEALRTLRSQVEGLLERRQEDVRVLEDTIRESVDKSIEVVGLKKEVEKLR